MKPIECTRRSPLRHVAPLAVGALLAGATLAEEPIFQADGLAIRGYDAVAYFTETEPTPGSERHTFEWRGATWRFASAENRERFTADPERWAPRYGGYCAYAVSQGYTAKTEPDAWTLHEGKLYLNYDRRVMAKWRRDKERYIEAADANWPAVLDD